ncbi:MAG TPA: sulfotransferase [Gemmatimonadales bacterium]|nr:sulfotransferase [Gemmatimonadales bacterium]
MTLAYAREWLRLHLWNRAVHAVCGRLYRDANRDPGRSLMVAGTARSGTTWLAEVIASQTKSRIMFEPFHSRLVPAFRAFRYFQYMRPEEPDDELLDYCRQVFTGAIRDRWIDREVEHLRPTNRVIKEIRANLFLKWIRVRFPEMPLVVIVRHPCAVVWSRLQLGWATDGDIEPLLDQSKLVQDFLEDRLDLIRSARTPEEKHAVIWCVSYLVPLTQLAPQDATVVSYERLRTEPSIEVPGLFRAIGLSFRASLFDRLDRPSKTTVAASPVMGGGSSVGRWARELSPAQVRRILAVVEGFGMGSLYGDSLVPIGSLSAPFGEIG